MEIVRVINNNVISSMDTDGREIIVMGKGVGFQKKPGQDVEERAVEKIFRLESPDMLERFKRLLADLPLPCLEVSDEIISYAKQELGAELNQNVYLTLTDHIGFAIDRFHQNLNFTNALYAETRRFYPEEFRVGKTALGMIEKKTGVRLPEDEAASIAIHLVNAEYNLKIRDTARMAGLLQELTEMAKQELGLQEGSIRSDRLLTNLKFLVHRLVSLQPQEQAGDPLLLDFVRKHCRKEYELAEKMQEYISKFYQAEMTEEETGYLAFQFRFAEDQSEMPQ